jgi:TfoX/Sxy family transcriptional regulator of competence genes
MSTPEDRYAQLAKALLGRAGVTRSQKKGFGSSGQLRVNDKIFAMLVRGRLVLKLPRQRVDALVAAEQGERFDPRRDGRLMKEWLVLAPRSEIEWLSLAKEALAFVAAAR